MRMKEKEFNLINDDENYAIDDCDRIELLEAKLAEAEKLKDLYGARGEERLEKLKVAVKALDDCQAELLKEGIITRSSSSAYAIQDALEKLKAP